MNVEVWKTIFQSNSFSNRDNNFTLVVSFLKFNLLNEVSEGLRFGKLAVRQKHTISLAISSRRDFSWAFHHFLAPWSFICKTAFLIKAFLVVFSSPLPPVNDSSCSLERHWRNLLNPWAETASDELSSHRQVGRYQQHSWRVHRYWLGTVSSYQSQWGGHLETLWELCKLLTWGDAACGSFRRG